MTNAEKIGGVAALVGFGAAIYLLSPVLTPFLIAALLAYLSNPLANQLERLKIPRTLAVVIVFTLIILLILLLILMLLPMLQRQLYILIAKLPDMLAWLQQVAVPWAMEHAGLSNTIDVDAIKTALADNWKQAGSIAAMTLKALSQSGMAVITWVINLLLIPVVTFYLLRDWEQLVAGIRSLLPRSAEPVVTQLVNECNEVLGAFFRGQLLVMVVLSIFYTTGLSLVGLQLALLIGMMAGLISIVPYMGFFVGLISACLAALVQFHDVGHIIYVLIVFVLGQALEGMVLVPWLVGDRIGLHPVAVIFAILAGGQLFGFTGVLLALPIAAVVMILLRHLRRHYVASSLYE